MSREPLWTVAGLTAAATAVIALLVAFGVPLTDEQQVAIMGVVAVLAPTVVAIVGRGLVTPNGSVVEWTHDGVKVLAGEANTLPDGTEIREVGPRRYVDDNNDGIPDFKE